MGLFIGSIRIERALMRETVDSINLRLVGRILNGCDSVCLEHQFWLFVFHSGFTSFLNWHYSQLREDVLWEFPHPNSNLDRWLGGSAEDSDVIKISTNVPMSALASEERWEYSNDLAHFLKWK